MAYAFGYNFGIDKELAHEDLLAAGNVINAYGLEVIERKTKSHLVYKPFKGFFVKFKVKVKFEDGNVIKLKFEYKLHKHFGLVTVDPQQMALQEGGMEELQKQLEALGLGGTAPEEKTNKKPIGFVTE